MHLITDTELTQQKKRSKQLNPEDFSPFIGAQESIWESDLTTSEKIVLLAILKHWSRKSPLPYPSTETLQNLTGLGRAAIYKNTASIERKGAMRIIRSVREVNRYDLSAVFAGKLGTCTISPCVESPVHPMDSTVHAGDQNSPCRSTPISPSNISNEYIKEELGAGAAPDSIDVSVPEKQETESHRRIKKVYLEEYERVHGEPPAWVIGDQQALAQLLKSVGMEKAERAIRNAFGDQWHKTKTTIQQIRSNPTKYLQLKKEEGKFIEIKDPEWERRQADLKRDLADKSARQWPA